MPYTATYTYGAGTSFPWMEMLAAFSVPGEFVSGPVSPTFFSDYAYFTANYEGALIIVECYTAYKTGESAPGPYAISDSGTNDWAVLTSQSITDGLGNIWWLQVWYCIANAAAASGIGITVTTPPSDEYFVARGAVVTGFAASTDYVPQGPFALLNSVEGNAGTGVPSLTLTAVNPQLLYASAIALPGGSNAGSLIAASPFTVNWLSETAGDEQLYVAAGEYESFEDSYIPPPTILPIVRLKKLPLALDFATCTYDQQNRLLKYEIYKALGADGSLVVPNVPWNPPVTITLRVWSESVDAAWNILKTPGSGVGFCGRRITIDPSANADWAGDYELMEATYTPFQGDTSGQYGGDTLVQSSAQMAAAANANSGLLELVLRTYNEAVLEGCDVSDPPTYVDVPGSLDMYPVVWSF